MSNIYYPRPLVQEELNAIAFFDRNGKGDAQRRIDALVEYYHETICDAGRYWQHCEFTREKLAGIQQEIDDLLGYWIERIRDWASD